MQELNFSEKACIERWAQSDIHCEDKECRNHFMDLDPYDPVQLKLMKQGYILVEQESIPSNGNGNGKFEPHTETSTDAFSDTETEENISTLKIAA